MKLYAGIDLHSTNSVIAIVNEAGKPLLLRKVANDMSCILERLATYKAELSGIVIEREVTPNIMVQTINEH